MVSIHTKTVLDLDRSILEEMLRGMPDPWVANFSFYGPISLAGVYGIDEADLRQKSPALSGLGFKPQGGTGIEYQLKQLTNLQIIDLIPFLKSQSRPDVIIPQLSLGSIIWANDIKLIQTALYREYAEITLKNASADHHDAMMHFANVAYDADFPVILNGKQYTRK